MDPEPVVFGESAILFGNFNDGGIELDHIDLHLGEMVVKEARQGAASEADDEHAVGIFHKSEAGGDEARVGQGKIPGIVGIHDALRRALGAKAEGAQSGVVFREQDFLERGMPGDEDFGAVAHSARSIGKMGHISIRKIGADFNGRTRSRVNRFDLMRGTSYQKGCGAGLLIHVPFP